MNILEGKCRILLSLHSLSTLTLNIFTDLLDNAIKDSRNEDKSVHCFYLITISVLPCPRELTLDRQLTNSIVISWKPPFDHNRLDVKSYHVYVDGVFKSLVRKNERTKALLENVDSKEVS